jgi:hypothetical protein
MEGIYLFFSLTFFFEDIFHMTGRQRVLSLDEVMPCFFSMESCRFFWR